MIVPPARTRGYCNRCRRRQRVLGMIVPPASPPSSRISRVPRWRDLTGLGQPSSRISRVLIHNITVVLEGTFAATVVPTVVVDVTPIITLIGFGDLVDCVGVGVRIKRIYNHTNVFQKIHKSFFESGACYGVIKMD